MRLGEGKKEEKKRKEKKELEGWETERKTMLYLIEIKEVCTAPPSYIPQISHTKFDD